MRRGLKILLEADGFVIFAFALLAPIYAIFVEQIGGDVLDAGITYSIYLFVLGISIFFISKWENHYKHKKKLLVFSYALFCLASVGYFFVANKYHLFFVQAVVGIAEALNGPIYSGLYTRFLEKGKSVSEWGLYQGMENCVAGVAALVGGAVSLYLGFKPLFVLMFIFSLVGLMISIKLKIKKKRFGK